MQMSIITKSMIAYIIQSDITKKEDKYLSILTINKVQIQLGLRGNWPKHSTLYNILRRIWKWAAWSPRHKSIYKD